MWIARDKEGPITVFMEMPILNGTRWISCGREILLPPSQYPEVTFENSPKELVIKDNL